jgi:hypothetical protein
MEWTIDNILNKDPIQKQYRTITWSFVAGSETLDKSSKTYTLTNEANVKAFTAYIDSLDITKSDKKKLKTGATMPQRTHVVTNGKTKSDDLLNDVGGALEKLCKNLGYDTPKSLTDKIKEITNLRTYKDGNVDSDKYHSCCVECNAEADTNQLLYAQAVNDLNEAANQIKKIYRCEKCYAYIISLEYLRNVLSEKLGTTGRRMCYCIDMDVVEQLRRERKTPAKSKNQGKGEDTLEFVLKKCDQLVKDAYEEFDKWLGCLIEQEKALYEKKPEDQT